LWVRNLNRIPPEVLEDIPPHILPD
jgi:hypothetical protein